MNPLPDSSESKRPHENSIIAFSIAFLGLWILFICVIWAWAVVVTESPPGVWHVYTVWREVQAKIEVPYALWRLAACLRESIPKRNATIADISTCLRGMGMKESFVPKVVA